jgi:hypothetical protein
MRNRGRYRRCNTDQEGHVQLRTNEPVVAPTPQLATLLIEQIHSDW